jgi:translation elongation factor EF-G
VLAHVFKVSIDPYVGKLGSVRVHQGTVTPGTQLYVGDGRKPFKVGHLYMLQGKNHVEVPSACRATSARWPRSTSCTSTPCCTTPPRTTTST